MSGTEINQLEQGGSSDSREFIDCAFQEEEIVWSAMRHVDHPEMINLYNKNSIIEHIVELLCHLSALLWM